MARQLFSPGNWIALDRQADFVNLWATIGSGRTGPSAGRLTPSMLNLVVASLEGADGLTWHLLLTSTGTLGWVWQAYMFREIWP